MHEDLKVGDEICVRFLDHCSTIGGMPKDPIEFLVWGRIDEVHDTHISVQNWGNLDVNDDFNTEAHTIIRSCILSVKHLIAVDEMWEWEDDDLTIDEDDDEGEGWKDA